MAVGDLISTGVPPMPIAIPNRIGSTAAMREALSVYLLNAQFRVYGGDDDPRDSLFNLEKVYDRWPRPDERLAYPCASIIELPDTVHDAALNPTPLEETLGQFDSLVGCEGETPKTCLWVTGEAVSQLQLDFWTNQEPDRKAIEGHISELFNLEEGGSSVALEGPELYYSQDIEYELVSHLYDDSSVVTERNERRLRCVVLASCAIVSLRLATLTATPQVPVEVIDPMDPGESEEE